MLINHRERASGQPRRQAEETRAGRELPTMPQGRSAPALTRHRIHQPVACLPGPWDSLRAAHPWLRPGIQERRARVSLCHHALLYPVRYQTESLLAFG